MYVSYIHCNRGSQADGVCGSSCDLSPVGGKFLVTNNVAGAYELHSWPSSEVPVSFIPREPTTMLAQPITSSKFLSHTCVVGGGVGQLIVWDTGASRLQNLAFHQRKSCDS